MRAARIRAAASAAGRVAIVPPIRARSPSACPSACSASAPRSRRRARRCSRSSTRRRPTSRASRTRSAACSWAIPTTGLVTAAQVSAGRFLKGGREALVSATYAARKSLKVGSKLDLNGTTFTVVGLVKPPLGGQGVDVYLPLAQLQKLSGQNGLVNVVLVRADDSDSVAAVEQTITSTYGQAEVASAKQVAGTISGSLVDAANLSRSLGLALSIVAAVAAFLLAALLALSSVGKRVRELGTLKALGWTQGKVVRQVAGESLAQGVLGGVLGVALGVGVALLIGLFGPTLTASSTTAGDSLFGVEQAARTASETISLSAPVGLPILLAGFCLAVVGGLLAGAAGALRAARLRPADALRTVE